MDETIQAYKEFCEAQPASKLCVTLSYDTDSLGQFYKSQDPNYKFSHHTSKLYPKLVETKLIYDINQQKTFGNVAKVLAAWLAQNKE